MDGLGRDLKNAAGLGEGKRRGGCIEKLKVVIYV
jgi:hypothetical protein